MPNNVFLLTTITALALAGCQTVTQQPITAADGNRQVNQVKWDKTGSTFTIPNDDQLKQTQTRIIFLRGHDQDPLQTSVNIGIDDRFQVSLQPGQHSQAITCAGNHSISAQITGNKNNILQDNTPAQTLDGQRTYYYLVVVNDNGQPSVGQITQKQALAVLNNPKQQSQQQTHQISRVVDTCQQPSIQTPTVVPSITPTVQPQPIETNTPIKLDVLFDFDSHNIKPNYYERLESMAAFMQAHTDMTAVLEGHTDSKGPASYNMRLSKARANAVKSFLIDKYGTDPKRLSTIGYGESRPIDSNDTAAGRQNNRRVVAIITQQPNN